MTQNSKPTADTPAPSPDSITTALGDIFASLLRAEDAEGAAAVAPLMATSGAKRALEALESGNPEHFHLFWSYPIEKLSRALLQTHGIPPRGDQAQVFLEYSFYERHFTNAYATFEGGACSADKGRWAMRAILRHLKTGAAIEVVHTDRTYWLPHRVLNSQESILGFFKALTGLLYGNPTPYLEALRALTESKPA